MNKYSLIIVMSLTIVLSLLAGCTGENVVENDMDLHVAVSILPQKYFVDRISGGEISVSVMVEPGANPATYEPKPEQLKDLSHTAVYFSIGVPFESVWLEKMAQVNENMLLINTIENIDRRPILAHSHGEEEDDEGHEDEIGSPDPHVWLSPELVKIQSRTIYEALVDLDPARQASYQANLEAFVKDIEALEQEIRQELSGLENRKFMVFHPSWGYFAADFGLEQIAIEVGGQEPSAQELAALIAEAKAEDIHVVLAQPEFSTQDAETIADEIGGEVLLISPLAEDWLSNMREVAKTFAEVLEK